MSSYFPFHMVFVLTLLSRLRDLLIPVSSLCI